MTTQDHTAALLPCPFCGGTKVVMTPPTCKRTDKYNPADRAFPIVHCVTCYAEANGKNWDQTGASAIAAWNTRAQPHQLTWDDAVRIARGCTDYGGGYRGDAVLFEAYQHGIQTVITALTHADPKDSQTRALMAMGAQPQQAERARQAGFDPIALHAHPSQQEDDARDAAKWRHAVENWRILRVEVMPGVRLFHPKGIPWRDLATQIQSAQNSVGEGGKNG